MLAYAPAACRAAIQAVLALDDQLAHLALGTREPTLAAMRLLWWHDAVVALGAGPAPAQPVLRAIAEHVLPTGVAATELAAIAEGWSALLDDDASPQERATRHGTERGARLFRVLARLLGVDVDAAVEGAGRGVALAQLAARTATPALADAARTQATAAFVERLRLPRAAKPVAMFAAAERIGLRRSLAPGARARLAAMLRVAFNPF